MLKSSHKRFTILFTYVMKGDKGRKIRSKRVNFGKKGVEEYIDNKDKYKRQVMMSRIKNYHNPFKPNFWKINLLNRGNEMK